MANQEDWRDGLKSTSEMNKYMLDHAINADCAFRVGPKNDEENQVFRCHKFLLSRCSPVFEAMFFGSLPEKTEEIRVTDIKPDIFKLLLTYIYTEEITFSNEQEAREVVFAADKYMLSLLKEESVNYLCRHVDSSNVLQILHTVVPLLNSEELKHACADMLQKHTKLVINQKDFKLSPESTLLLILQQDTLSCEEYELVMAVERWAEHQVAVRKLPDNDVSIRTCLEPLIPHMRFRAMSKLEFESGPGQSSWLTEAEKQYVLKPRQAEAMQNISDKYLPRDAYVFSNVDLNPQNFMCQVLASGGSNFEVKFKCCENLTLHGLRMYSQIKSPQFKYNSSENEYCEEIQIKISSESNFYFEPRSSNHVYINVSFNSMIDVIFDYPVTLYENANVVLEIKCQAEGIYPVSKNRTCSNSIKIESNSQSPVESLIFEIQYYIPEEKYLSSL